MADTGSSTFTCSDSDFILVFNHISNKINICDPVTSIDAPLDRDEYDSLDLINLFGWLSEIFNIDIDPADVNIHLRSDSTLKEIKELVIKNMTEEFNLDTLKKYDVCQ